MSLSLILGRLRCERLSKPAPPLIDFTHYDAVGAASPIGSAQESQAIQQYRSELRFDFFMTSRRITKPKGVDLPTRQRLLDRYKQHLQFAELKISAGDRIGAENDFQHAEHFFRAASQQKDTDQI